MPIIDPNTPKPTPQTITNVQRAYRLRKTAESLRSVLFEHLKQMKRIAQNGDGVNALAAQLNSENAGDAAEFQTIYNDGRALLALLDAAANTELGGLS